jgi:sorting nexin-17
MTDPVALNLLYVQTVCDVEKGWINCTRDVKMKLSNLQSRLVKREYIELARTLKYYGFMQFMPCYCDFPKPQTKVLIAIGDQELSMRLVGPGQFVKEGCFKVTRMRCWRITATHVTIATPRFHFNAILILEQARHGCQQPNECKFWPRVVF